MLSRGSVWISQIFVFFCCCFFRHFVIRDLGVWNTTRQLFFHVMANDVGMRGCPTGSPSQSQWVVLEMDTQKKKKVFLYVC